MKKYKFEYITFTSFNYMDVAKHFEKMALKGWKVIQISLNIVIYKRIKPQPIYYCVDMFVYKSNNETNTLSKNDYLEMCEASLWKFIGQSGMFYIFSSNKPLTPIQSDQELMYQRDLKNTKDNIYSTLVIQLCFIVRFILGISGLYVTKTYLIVCDAMLFMLMLFIWCLFYNINQVSKYHQLKKLYKQTKLGLMVKETKIASVIKPWLLLIYIAATVLLAFISDTFKIVVLIVLGFSITFQTVHLCLDGIMNFLGKKYKYVKTNGRVIVDIVFIALLLISWGYFRMTDFNVIPEDKVRHYLELPAISVNDHVFNPRKDENFKSTVVKEYNHYIAINYTQMVSTVETYYHCRFEFMADTLFERLRKENDFYTFMLNLDEAKFFCVDQIYHEENVILLQKEKHILYLEYPESYTKEQIKEVINSYIL